MMARLYWRMLAALPGHRVRAALALAAYLSTGVGIPLPASPPRKSGAPFPCQDHVCGCMSAEQCWRSCCCHTVEERWAWARAHNVEPPEYAERPAAPGWQTTRLRDRERAGSCCSKHGHEGGCCEHKQSRRASGTRWVWTTAALSCHGSPAMGLAAATAVPPPAAVIWWPRLAPVAWLTPSNTSAQLLLYSPPVPPPRLHG